MKKGRNMNPFASREWMQRATLRCGSDCGGRRCPWQGNNPTRGATKRHHLIVAASMKKPVSKRDGLLLFLF